MLSKLLGMVAKDLVSYTGLAIEVLIKIAAKHFFPEADPLAATALHKGHAQVGYRADSLAVHHG